MWTFVICWVLCVGELVTIVNTLEVNHIGYDAELSQNQLKFGYGINFKFNGEVHNNLDRVWIVQRFNLPRELDKHFVKGLQFGLNCNYTGLDRILKSHPGSERRLNLLKEICKQTVPLLHNMAQGAFQYKQTLRKLINSDLYHALHGLSVVEELRYKRHVKVKNNSSNLNDQKSQFALQAEANVEYGHGIPSTTESTTVKTRQKRGFLAFLPLIGKIATIAVEALGSHLQKKRKRAMVKAVTEMQNNQFLTRNELYQLEKDFLMYGEYNVRSTDGIIRMLSNLTNRTAFLENMLNGKVRGIMDKYLKENTGYEIYSHQINLYVQAMRERYLRMPENLINELRLLLRSIATLSKGYLPPQLFSPTDLVKISMAALKMVQKRHPDYVLAIPQTSSYYDMRLVTFGIDELDRLVVCFPIFVKDFSRESMTLYQIETVPVPIVDENLEANSYSQVTINKPYIATNDDYYIQLVMEELFMCKQIKQIYFCEELFLVKHKTKHSCESAIFYDLSSTLIKHNCEFKYMYNTSVIPSVLDGGSKLILANMLPEKRLICTYDQGLAKPLPSSPYVMVDRKILCHCHIQSGLTYVLKNVGSCNITSQPKITYTVNLAFFTLFENLLNDTTDLSIEPTPIEQSFPLALEDFSQDPDFPVYCQDTAAMPETLAQLAHIQFQKKLYLKNKNEFLFEGKAGIEKRKDIVVSDTPISISNGNSFSFMFTIAFHIFVFLGSSLSLIMLLPQVYVLLKQKKLRGLVAAITMFKQVNDTSAAPTVMSGVQTTKLICHDPWVSFVLTCLTVIGMAAYMYKHGRHLALIYGHRFTNLCQVHVLACTKTHFVKIKVATVAGSPNLFKINKTLEVDQVTFQRGYIWDYLHIKWGNVKITHAGTVVILKQHMCVPLLDRIRLRRLFPYVQEFVIMVQQGDTWMAIQQEELNNSISE